jgi:hypothetical protein
MELVKYRNDRKAEGASKLELSVYDNRIYAIFNSTSNIIDKLDLELLLYRRQMKEENASNDIIINIDKHIHASLSKKPPIIESNICNCNSITISNKVSRTLSNPSYIVLSGPSHVFKGQHFTVNAQGDWENLNNNALWLLNEKVNCGCKNSGCGFYAPNNPGIAKVKYIVNGLIGTLDIQIVDNKLIPPPPSPTPPPPPSPTRPSSPTEPPSSIQPPPQLPPSSPTNPPSPLSNSKKYINLNIIDDDEIDLSYH